MALTRVTPDDAATKTYQYLRLGMLGIVGLLAVSMIIEIVDAGCFQDSISAYYFTPVRTIFVGGLMAIGAALIFISGRTLAEDVLLSLAGFCAPLVAIIPTTDVGRCYSTLPPAAPIVDGGLASWVVAGIRNNVEALLIMGVAGLVAVAVLQGVTTRRSPWTALRESATSTKVALGLIAVVLGAGWLAFFHVDEFFERAHGPSAVAMFVLLAAAVATNAWGDRAQRRFWFWAYTLVAASMVVVGLAVFTLGGDWRYRILVLEAIEIGLFAIFWALQTARYWNRTV